MWIRHNYALYNSSDIVKIYTFRSKLKAEFRNGTTAYIGDFNTSKECEDIFNSVSRALLFEDKDNPGIIIKDTKAKKDE